MSGGLSSAKRCQYCSAISDDCAGAYSYVFYSVTSPHEPRWAPCWGVHGSGLNHVTVTVTVGLTPLPDDGGSATWLSASYLLD
jgi:hypothetical protein